jgi:hypothetical protein
MEDFRSPPSAEKQLKHIYVPVGHGKRVESAQEERAETRPGARKKMEKKCGSEVQPQIESTSAVPTKNCFVSLPKSTWTTMH